MKRLLTPAQEEELRRLHPSMTMAELGDHLRITSKQANKIALRLGLSKNQRRVRDQEFRPVTAEPSSVDERIALFIRVIGRGKVSSNDIRALTGTSEPQCRRALVKMREEGIAERDGTRWRLVNPPAAPFPLERVWHEVVRAAA